MPVPVRKLLLLVPVALSSPGPEVLVLEEGVLPPRDTRNILLNWKARFPFGLFGLLIRLSQKAYKRNNSVLGGQLLIQITEGNCIVSPYGGKEDHVWSAGDNLELLLVLKYPVIKVNAKLQQPVSVLRSFIQTNRNSSCSCTEEIRPESQSQ